MKIPHSKPQIGPEEIAAATRVLGSGQIAQGSEVAAFEEECAAYVGRQYGIATNSGTAALHLALIAMRVSRNDAVALPSYACAALYQPVFWQLAEPVLCDVGSDYNLDPDDVPGTSKVAIVPHLFGARAFLPENVPCIEDIAQSIGGPTGRDAPIAIASFYATKMFTTGEGGMLLTDDSDIAALARDLRDYDNRDTFNIRYAYKMTDLQAAIGREQLKRLDSFVTRRKEIAARYNDAFSGSDLDLPTGKDHIWFRYVIRTPQRNGLQTHLAADGIDAKLPVHRPAHHLLGGFFPNSDSAHSECLSIPVYPDLTDQENSYVIDSILRFLDSQPINTENAQGDGS